ncbi:M60 family metallopeptidase [Embleya sp. MST-111070]|uniref:M60 family metallopeptidase n=1 Tax=Embleya sp. MST-111070 TaxID=3398231 RepID=UPI003F738243
MSEVDIGPAPYGNLSAQSFDVVEQADGSWGIRSRYHACVLTMSETSVHPAPYDGNGWQSFDVVGQSDGSMGIRGRLHGRALTMSETSVHPAPYDGNVWQSFDLVEQVDGSLGIRSRYRRAAYVTFRGTVDTLDAIRRVGNWFVNSDRQPTGFHLPPNTRMELQVSLAAQADDSRPTLQVGAPDTNPDTDYAMPRLYPLREGLNFVTDPGGGMIYFQMNGIDSRADITFRDGMEKVPFFEYGKTTPDEYREMLRTLTRAPQVELVSERAIVTVKRAAAMEHQDTDPNRLMETYERIISVEEEVLGLDGSNPLHTRAPLRFHLAHGNYRGIGEAYAAHSYTAYPDHYGAQLLVPDELARSWGIAHELGHQNQMLGYLPHDFDEVTTNIASLAVQRSFGLRSPLLEKDPDGKDVWDRALAKVHTPSLDVTDLDLYERLAALEQLRLAFGDQFWPRMNRTTREKWASNAYHPDRAKAYDNLALFSSITAHADLRDFYSAWGMPVTEQGNRDIAALNLPAPTTDPTQLRETE